MKISCRLARPPGNITLCSSRFPWLFPVVSDCHSFQMTVDYILIYNCLLCTKIYPGTIDFSNLHLKDWSRWSRIERSMKICCSLLFHLIMAFLVASNYNSFEMIIILHLHLHTVYFACKYNLGLLISPICISIDFPPGSSNRFSFSTWLLKWSWFWEYSY